MDKKNIEALAQTLSKKPEISGTEGNLVDKASLSKAAFRNLELKRELSFEAPELREVRIAGISPNLYGKEAEISKEMTLREMKRRTLPPKEQARLKGSAIKMDLQSLVSKFNTKKHNQNPENGKKRNKGNGKNSEIQMKKGSSKGKGR